MMKTLMLAVLAGGVLVAGGPALANDQDDELQTKVESRLRYDSQLRNDKVEVRVVDGIVTLEGKVDNAAEKSRATRLAMSAGAQRIENNLELKGAGAERVAGDVKAKAKTVARELGTEVNDTLITSKVKADIALDNALKGSDISVDTNQGGVVTLTGTVPTEAEHQRALAVAHAVKGVRTVKDALTVTATDD